MPEERMSQHPRAVVVGASGYVGTNLVPRLLAGGMELQLYAGANREVKLIFHIGHFGGNFTKNFIRAQ